MDFHRLLLGFSALVFLLPPVVLAESLAVAPLRCPTELRSQAQAARELLSDRLREIGFYSVADARDRDEAVKNHADAKDIIGCDEPTCARFFAQATGAGLVVTGELREDGDHYRLTYSLFRDRTREMIGGTSFLTDMSDFETALKGLAREISQGHDIVVDPEGLPDGSYVGPGAATALEAADWEKSVAPGDGNGHEFVLLPLGSYDIGGDRSDTPEEEKPRHRVIVGDVEFARTETTRVQFARFLAETGYRPGTLKAEAEFPSPGGYEHHPMTMVTWADADAYCRWLTLRTGITHRLPTEAEWEAAASGTTQRLYPWGDDDTTEALAQRANSMSLHEEYTPGAYLPTKPVGSFPPGRSPIGLDDMAGNVWEWCLDGYDPEFYRRLGVPMENPLSGKMEATGLRVIRGGAWNSSPRYLRVTVRIGTDWDARQPDIGFRVVREQVASLSEDPSPKKKTKKSRSRNRSSRDHID